MRQPSGRFAYVNGRYQRHGEAAVHIEDRGLQFGDSIYEVFSVRDGNLRDEDGHLDRLERSLREIEMTMPMGRAALQLVLREVVRRNDLKNGLLYMQVTRGASNRDHPIPANIKPTLIVTARAMDADLAEAKRRNGVSVITTPDERWARRDIKTTQLLPNLLAKTRAKRAGAYEAWLVDADGVITEGSSTNAWIVDASGQLITRDLSHSILPGVTRAVILEAAKNAQIRIVEKGFTLADALAAKEAFISSANGAAVPVTHIDNRPIGDGKPGPLTLRVQALYDAATGSAQGAAEHRR